MNGITTNPPGVPNGYYMTEGQASAKSEAVKLSPEQADAARKIIEEKIVTQLGKGQAAGDTLKPVLAAPRTPLTQKSADAKSANESYYALMAQLITLLADSSIDTLKARAEMYSQFSANLNSASKEVLDQVERETSAYELARQNSDAAEREVQSARQNISQLTEQKTAIETELTQQENQLQQAKAQGEPQSVVDALAEQIAALKQQMAAVTAKLGQANDQLTVAQRNVGVASIALNKAQSELEKSLNYLDSLNKSAANVNDAVRQQNVTNSGMAALLMAQLITLMGESNEESMRANLEFSRKVQAAQQEQLKSDAEEVEKQQAKNKQMQETMGCIGKILGAIITVVSLVAAVFTGGASLAIAAIGIALMVADTIYQKVTGNESFIAQALKPIMEHVFMPIIQAIAGAIENVLKQMGVSADVAQIVGAALAMIVIIVAVISAAVIAKNLPVDKIMGKLTSVLSKVLNDAIKSAMKSVVSNVKLFMSQIDDLLSQFSKPLTNFLNQLLGNEVKVKTAANVLHLSADVMEGVNATATGATDIAAGYLEKTVDDAMAEITRMLSASEIMQRFSETITDGYARTMENINQMMNTAAESAGSEIAVGRQILSHVRA